jgi:prepilin-type N-terminal cleavage/methylation domain-containing protein
MPSTTPIPSQRPLRRAFTLLELLICIAIIGALLAILVPALSRAKKTSYNAVCGNNLRQIGFAFSLYVQEHADRLPSPQQIFAQNADWKFGGLDLVGPDRTPVLASARPINKYIDDRATVATRSSSLFSCPADAGVWDRATARRGEPGTSMLPARTCFLTFGNSYRANSLLLERRASRGETKTDAPLEARGYALHEVTMTHSKVLLAGDPAWFYATRSARDLESSLDASWHARADAGNMLALDGSVRAENFADDLGSSFVLEPR